MGKIQEKKHQKRQALLDAAYELFMEQGAGKTSIDNIVNRANVAKGTFYLYFKDKDALSQALVWRLSDHIFDEALAQAEQMGDAPYKDKVIAIADYLLERLRQEPFILRLIRHNLKWPRVDELQEDGAPLPVLEKVFRVLRSCPELEDQDEKELYQRLSAIVSMCVSVCYGCVIEQRPASFEEMKPVLFDIIRKSI